MLTSSKQGCCGTHIHRLARLLFKACDWCICLFAELLIYLQIFPLAIYFICASGLFVVRFGYRHARLLFSGGGVGLPFAAFRRRQSVCSFEVMRKVAAIAQPDGVHNLLHSHEGVITKFLSLFHPQFFEILRGRETGFGFEEVSQT